MIPSQGHSVGLPAERAIARGRTGADTVVLAGALVVFSLLALQLTPFVPDDSFISYRYAANLAAGHGLRFNPTGAPIEGYSNFLWIVLLVPAARLGLDLVTVGAWLGGVLGAVCVAMLWVILRRRGHTGWHLAVPVGLLAVSAPLLLYSISGMETVLFALWLLAVVFVTDLVLTRPTVSRGVILAIVASLAAMTRPEGILTLPVVAAGLLVMGWRQTSAQRRSLWRALGAALLTFVFLQVVYHVLRVAYFGEIWPTPFLSKGASDSSLIASWATNFRQFFLRQTHYYAPLGYYYGALFLPALAGLWLVWKRGEKRPVEWIALAMASIFALAYLNFVDWMPGMRYYAPLVGLWLIPLSLLGPELQRPSDGSGGMGSNVAYLLLGITLALFSLSGLAALRLDSQQLQTSTQVSMVELGHWLRETMPPDTVLAMSDVGATPYYSGFDTVDINPESLTDRHIAENGWSSDYFFEVDPDVVVLTAFSLTKPDFHSVYEELYAMPLFQSTYRRIGVLRNDWYQDRSYWVFVRQNVEVTSEQMAAFPDGIIKP